MSSSSSSLSYLHGMTWLGLMLYLGYSCLSTAYNIRLLAIEEYGPVIHEFDPYFNYRATEYLYFNGAKKFFTWFDHKVWYPLGRPVGTTIYPGMQFTAVWIKTFIVGERMSLNDVCCYMPAWFGVIASFLVGCIAYECTLECNTKTSLFGMLRDITKGVKSDTDEKASGENSNKREVIFGWSSPAVESGVVATGLMAIVPAHLMRSVGGGFDNESVAISAMALTFYFWVRSLRGDDDRSHLYGILAGFAYFYMVASWGGYVFVLNMVGLHAVLLVLLGRFSTKVYLSYSLFYVVGTILAIQIPVVGWTPLKSLEQMGPCAVFLGYQILQFCELEIRKKKMGRVTAWKYRLKIISIGFFALILFAALVPPKGYFGPFSSRVRGLFVKHTKTGNPLVDSVAEHQPADNKAYWKYLQHVCLFAPIGFAAVLGNFGDGPSFLIAYATTAFFFSNKMVRLILLMAPIASILSGISISRIAIWCLRQLWNDEDQKETSLPVENKKKSKKGILTSEGKKKKFSQKGSVASNKSSDSGLQELRDTVSSALKSTEGVLVKRTVAMLIIVLMYLFGLGFRGFSWRMAHALSNPSIIMRAQLRDGTPIMVDDYREAYWWVRDNTPEDARIMAWWDYGYQITAIANRTTIADGNTWNHEHIALLGKVLTTNVDEGYDIARHLADYVLIWAGGGGDDLAKSPHLARIANSVYRDMCPGDPTCRAFGFLDRQGTPSPMMRSSFLYNLHSHGLKEGVQVDSTKFMEVFRSKYGKVRVYKMLGVDMESKTWTSNPKNRVCDVEGGWFCRGQYPPALKEVLAKKKDFAQLEDFNRVQDKDEDYQKQYFQNLNNPELAKSNARREMDKMRKDSPDGSEESKSYIKAKPTQAEVDAFYNNWEDTESTTHMWKLINSGDVNQLEEWLESNPLMAHMRSSDGRGPMWWAFESRRQDLVKVLMKYGVGHMDKDKYGKTPVDLLENS